MQKLEREQSRLCDYLWEEWPGRWKRKCRNPVAILAPQEGWHAEHSVSKGERTRNDCRVTGRDQTT